MLAWKNGLGISHVIASHPDGAGYDTVDWQVGTTGITANCPFSSLPGFDRQFMVLEGEGVELHCRGANGSPDVRQRIDAPLDPFAFRGDWQTECRLLGAPVQVFNVLTRRGRCSARVSVSTMRQSTALEKDADETMLAFIAAGAIEFEGCSEALATNDALIADESKPARFSVSSASARVVIVRISPIRPAAGQ